MIVAEIETLKICYNTYYRVRHDSVEFDTANDYIFIHCKHKPIIGSLFVLTFENPSVTPVVPMIRGFAHYYGEYIIDYYPKQGYHVFGTNDRHNCDWDEASERFQINYNYSAGWRIHADSFKLFFFSKLPDYAPLDICSISTSLVITNDKGKSNGIVPLNEAAKVDKKYLDNYITVEEADQKYLPKTTTTEPTTTPALTEDMKKEIFDMIYPPKSYVFIPTSERCADITTYLKYGTLSAGSYIFKLTRDDGNEINTKIWQRTA